MTPEQLREEWVPVVGFEDYMVSDHGNVKRIKTGKILSQRDCNGYARVSLYNGKQKSILAHILVLNAFVGLAPDGFEASHLNGIRKDNRLKNLVWESRKENHAHKKEHGTHQSGENGTSTKLTWADVRQIRAIGRSKLQTELAEMYNISPSVISSVLRNVTWRTNELGVPV